MKFPFLFFIFLVETRADNSLRVEKRLFRIRGDSAIIQCKRSGTRLDEDGKQSHFNSCESLCNYLLQKESGGSNKLDAARANLGRFNFRKRRLPEPTSSQPLQFSGIENVYFQTAWDVKISLLMQI